MRRQAVREKAPSPPEAFHRLPEESPSLLYVGEGVDREKLERTVREDGLRNVFFLASATAGAPRAVRRRGRVRSSLRRRL